MNLRFRFAAALLLFLLLGLALQAVSARAQSAAPDLAAYWALVKESRAEITALSGKSDVDVKAGLLALAARWEQVSQVRLDDGTLLNIDNSYWVSQLRAEKPDLLRLATGFDALLAARPDSQKAGTDANLADLREILARPEFNVVPSQTPGWITDLLDRFFRWLSRILGQRVELSAPGNLTLQIFGVVAAVLVILVLVFALRGLFADLAADSSMNPEDGAADMPINAQAALARAEGLSGQGDYRSAVRYLYLSALLILDERSLLYYDRTRTNREYLRDLASRPQTASLLRAVIDVFDRVWYGFQPLDAETYRRYAEQVNELKEQK